MLLLKIIACLLMPPADAAVFAAALHGELDEAPRLLRICRRESRCTYQAVHKVDSHLSRRVWGMAVRAKQIDPEQCSMHEYGAGRRWSTRGAFGMMAAFSLKYLEVCAPPEILDIPLVSAYIAVHRVGVAKRSNINSLKRWAYVRRRR